MIAREVDVEIPSYYRFTSLPRDIDLDLVEHRWMIVMAAGGGLAAVAQSALSGMSSIVQIAQAALIGAIGVFLAWAIARELDPDHQPSALVGGLAGGAAVLAWGAPSILVSGLALLLLRLVARTTGLTPRPADTITVVGLGLALGLVRDLNLLLVTAVGLALDGWLHPEHENHKYAAVGLALAGAVAQLAPLATQETVEPLGVAAWAGLGALAVLFLALVARRWQVEAPADRTGEPLTPERVHAGQGLGVLLAVGIALGEGERGLRALSVLWAAIAGIAIFHAVRVGISTIGTDERAGSGG